MTMPWPEAYSGIRDVLNSEWHVQGDIEILREFSAGNSTARVYLVDLEATNHRGSAILKLDTVHPSLEEWRKEAGRYVQAEKSVPAYADEHLPRLLHICDQGGQTALLCSLAGDSLNYTQPMFRLDTGQQVAAIQRVARGILEQWNDDYKIVDHALPGGEALQSWLGYRIHPQSGGRIHAFLEERCNLSCTEKACSFLGHWIPNPCAYAADHELWPQGHAIKLAIGRSHGDLHGHNILVRIEGPYDYNYYLIDLAFYEESSFLFFDHAYFELSHLLHYRSNAQLSRWLKILEALVVSSMDAPVSGGEPDDQGLLSVVGSSRREVQQWIRGHEPGRKDHMEGQVLLARVAAGLNFLNKEIDERLRKMAFLYSAFHLRRYLEINQLQWEQNGPILDFREPVQAPQTEGWRQVLRSCDYFEKHSNAYVMITGKNVRLISGTILQVLGRIPWSLIFDFDPSSRDGGIAEAVRPILRKQRFPHTVLPDNLQEINYHEATCWFMAAGLSEREDTIISDYDMWRRRFLPAVREVANTFRKAVSPQPVIVLLLPNGLRDKFLRAIWESLDEVLGDQARYVVIDDGSMDLAHLKGRTHIDIIQSDLESLMSGLWQIYGGIPSSGNVRLPKRGISEEESSCIYLEETDCEYLKEDLEIVHGGVVEEPQEGRRVGHDFWRGHEITWTELDMEADVRRDLSEPLKKQILVSLEGSRTVSIPLYHSPGAGGTTLARRICWDLKDLYPAVRIHNFSQYTASRVERLFHITRLPVLLVMEAAEIPPPVREKLYKELRGRNVRAVFLYVVRTIEPRRDFSLNDPIVEPEVQRFYEKYKNVALDGRIGDLRRLAHDEDMLPYRSPFFFGFYAFRDQFVRVPDFVKALLSPATKETMTFLCFLSLVTRYSQATIPDAVTRKLLNLTERRPLRLNEILGQGPVRLVLHRDHRASIIHPLIAEEILKQALGQEESLRWELGLMQLCCSFIRSLTEVAGSDSDTVLEVITQMFISRDPWQVRRDRRRHFSELILTIPNVAGQHKVLLTLKDCCNNEAHFWNHLGRHHIYAMGSKYDQAEVCVQRAMELDPKNDIHHHALGMVYRFEIRRRLEKLIRTKAMADQGLADIVELANKAEKCFRKARELDAETEYGYITHIQLLIEIIDRLFRLSGYGDYAQFFSSMGPASAWCKEKLPVAQDLLRQVKTLQAEENLSRFTIQCEAEILNLYGRHESMIDSLQSLLRRAEVEHAPIRRLIANAYYAHRHHNWSEMKSRDLRKIHILMSQNLDADPTNSRDLWMWFQSYRRTSAFDMLEALDRLNAWTMREDSLEAHYYLYILHFIRWRQGILEDSHFVKENISRCQALAGKLGRVRPIEWLGIEPEWCPLIHRSELGSWDRNTNFYDNTGALASVQGVVRLIKGPQAGTIAVGPFDVFFVPGNEFLPGRDENEGVRLFLGFSYDGLRGWGVKRVGQGGSEPVGKPDLV